MLNVNCVAYQKWYNPMKRLPAFFYALPSGREPVRDWLKELSMEDRRAIGEDIKDVEFAWPIGLPLCRPLREGLWEVRSNLAQGRTARVIFCEQDGRMILLHAFIKKSQKTPAPDIELAIKRMKDIA
ncbi:type II toxin-antitoxin system RelE/ParE family toxin [Bradyrhizobium sp. SRS-191]|uniref:type II toxin-antitoxin system RelE/ParE family toxin n=1 Tax=Bradyrhizobium sp. SRS-191 TaxID=2962606 RepID=UPI00211E8460|nr:type II toxin-antitoxin system RelE/ParE family toxin [Bradyrhizobium sp. SRS-191]